MPDISIDRLVAVTLAGSPATRVEPITLAKTKHALKITSTSEDDLISEDWIPSAREFFEEYSGRQSIDAIYEYTTVPVGNQIELPRPPLSEVLSVVSVDPLTGAESLIDPSLYRVELSGVPGNSPERLQFDLYCPPGSITCDSWPTGKIRVTRVCGYGNSPEQMPAMLRSALYLLVGNLYRNRSEVTAETLMKLPLGAELIMRGLKYDALVVQR